MFYVCCALLYVHSSIAIILMGKRELVVLLNLSSWCLVVFERLFLAVPRGCLQFVIVVFPDHTHLLFWAGFEKITKVFLFLCHTVERSWLTNILSVDYSGRPWQVAYINFMQNTHQIQVLTKPLCRAQAIFYSAPNNKWRTKYRGLTYSAK